ncbi:MAG: hypothetical protein H0W24_11170 [Lysobacter sp.]|nr:hypothetical protein [Lysobacter sp.]
MRLNIDIDIDNLRLRLSEAELEQLLENGRLAQTWICPDGTTSGCALALETAASSGRCEGNLTHLEVTLPREAFATFAAERPRRDGFTFSQGATRTSVEIDVRDSRKRRSGRTEATPRPDSHPSMSIDHDDPTSA